jgi:hypothetical protein
MRVVRCTVLSSIILPTSMARHLAPLTDWRSYGSDYSTTCCIPCNYMHFLRLHPHLQTDNVFDSTWCMHELKSAVQSKTNIILVVKVRDMCAVRACVCVAWLQVCIPTDKDNAASCSHVMMP